MNNEWTAPQYAIDNGWNYDCIEATARLGVSEADAEGLTAEQQESLLSWCQEQVAEFEAKS